MHGEGTASGRARAQLGAAAGETGGRGRARSARRLGCGPLPVPAVGPAIEFRCRNIDVGSAAVRSAPILKLKMGAAWPRGPPRTVHAEPPVSRDLSICPGECAAVCISSAPVGRARASDALCVACSRCRLCLLLAWLAWEGWCLELCAACLPAVAHRARAQWPTECRLPQLALWHGVWVWVM